MAGEPVVVNSKDSGNGMGFLLGIIALIVFVVLFLIYGLPMITNSVNQSQTPQVNVPKDINVNVNK